MKGKKITSIINSNKIDSLIDGIKEKLKTMNKFFGYYLSLEKKKLKMIETAISRFKYLNKIFKNKVALIHGRMTKEEIDLNMKNFLEKKTMILVSTTVI